jgi:hypothetical protein
MANRSWILGISLILLWKQPQQGGQNKLWIWLVLIFKRPVTTSSFKLNLNVRRLMGSLWAKLQQKTISEWFNVNETTFCALFKYEMRLELQ